MLALGANGRGRAGLLSALRPQDVFATSLYTGTGASRTITNGLDLAGKGGLVWMKARSTTPNHFLYDTTRGSGFVLASNVTDAEVATNANALSSFNADGFSIGGNPNINGSSTTFASWSFRRASKFFDIVTYTGDGTSGRVIPHALGIKPGMIIVKQRNAASDWFVRMMVDGLATPWGRLNFTDAFTGSNSAPATAAGYVNADATGFTIVAGASGVGGINGVGGTYVAYLFAHDPDTTNGIVQCGSFTTNGSGGASVTLGWQPQFVIIKGASTTGDWIILDTSRGWTAGNDAYLLANTSGAEASVDFGAPTTTGFTIANGFAASGQTIVFLAIRAPI